MEPNKKPQKMTILVGIPLFVFVLVIVIGLLVTNSIKENNDKQLIEDLNQQIINVESTTNQDEESDSQINNEINNNIEDDTESLDELESEFDLILNSLDDVDTIESNIGNEVD